jgi:uncharacterized membrane protein
LRRYIVQYAYTIVIAIHALAAVFWAGSSFVLTRNAIAGGEALLRQQMGAATVAVLSGGYLWNRAHEGSFGRMEQVLAIGVLCALIALLVQALVAGRVVGRLTKGEDSAAGGHARFVAAQRIAAGLLAVTTVSMVVARYV